MQRVVSRGVVTAREDAKRESAWWCDVCAEMSQRQGAPRSTLSKLVLKIVSCLICEDEPPNEWQTVWDGRESQHHQTAPSGDGRYVGHTSRFNLEIQPLHLVPTVLRV